MSVLHTQAELNDVLEDEEETPAPTPPAITPTAPKVSITSHSSAPAAPGGATGLESLLLERAEMYKVAISNARVAGDTSKVRRYDRGAKVKWRRKRETLYSTSKQVDHHTLPSVKLVFICPKRQQMRLDIIKHCNFFFFMI